VRVDPWTAKLVESALQGREEHPDPDPDADRRAAVAMVLRFDPEPEVALMRRVTRADDRWSGQISLPGGGHESEDSDMIATAIRETREEIGLDLQGGARLLGALDPMQARARGEFLSMWVWPYVFELEREATFEIGPEADEAFWFPLQTAASGELDQPFSYEKDGARRELPSWHFEERIVWGMTHIMLTALIETL